MPLSDFIVLKLFVNYCSLRSFREVWNLTRVAKFAAIFLLFLSFEWKKKQFMKQHDMRLKIINFLMYF